MGWNSISFAPGNPLIGVICGDDNYILYTVDGGLNWSFATENIATGTLDCEEVHMTSATTGWIVGDNGTICTTTNGGATWTVQTPLSALTLMDVNFRNPDQPLYGWIVRRRRLVLLHGERRHELDGGGRPGQHPDVRRQHGHVPVARGRCCGSARTMPRRTTARPTWCRRSAIRSRLPYTLGQNYPNPFNPATTFKFTLPSQDFVTLNVYDVSGRLVAKVLSKDMGPGEHAVRFDASGLVSGVYFYRLETSAGMQTKKMVLLQ